MLSYRSECWGRGDDDAIEAAGGSAHSDEVLLGCRGWSYYLASLLQRQTGHMSNITTVVQPLPLLPTATTTITTTTTTLSNKTRINHFVS